MPLEFYTVTKNNAEDLLQKYYGISAKVSYLQGYEDVNFLVETVGKKYILKISKPDFNPEYFDFQEKLLHHLNDHLTGLEVPKIIPSQSGNPSEEYIDNAGNIRKIKLLSWIDGRLWSSVNPKSDTLRHYLGVASGKLTSALIGFKHPYSKRQFEWDTAQSLWTKDYLHLFDKEQAELIHYFQNRFENQFEAYGSLRKSIVHNDVNDNNIVVSEDVMNPEVIGLIDFGDAIHTQTINDLAICCAYGIMHFADPLDACLPIVKGYHQSYILQEKELEHLYNAIAMRLVVSVTKSAIGKQKEPKNEYLTISEKPAWDLLRKWHNISSEFAHFAFRDACDYTAHPNEAKFRAWAKENNFKISDIIPSAPNEEVYPLDLSVGSSFVGHTKEAEDLELFDFKIKRLQREHPNNVIAGGYCEPRQLYATSAYEKIGNQGREHRTMHIGIDFWLPESTPIHALYDGEVITAANDAGDKEYGGLLILKHKTEDFEFFTLYAHNTPETVLRHKIGDKIKRGQKISELGNYPENGNWVSHLHFQVMMSMLDYKTDYPGVVYPNQLDIWKSIIPNPNFLFKNPALDLNIINHDDELIEYRNAHLGRGLSLQYNQPLRIVRGQGVYLIDSEGRKYLDTVNNVAHVGHEHYDVVKDGQNQMAILNTNTRYLHEKINELASELLETLPKELCVLHFVNSGSEANELAIRMAKIVTGTDNIIASEVGYHGNTNKTVDISSYKFDGRGGTGAPKNTYIFPLPDAFRGKYRGENAGKEYAREVEDIVDSIKNKNEKVGALIVEPIISCGGQIELPSQFLKQAYQFVRNAGGICISDEVQTGCGRMGKTFWGFQLYDVVPDIVTIGKPLGNGHPVAAVACTREIADSFANGMEYFNTFGGNPVSCAIATEVLRVVKREKLQENASIVGGFLKTELIKLSKEFPIIGDVRGQGLFLGIEFVDAELNPLTLKAKYLVNRMKDHGVLMSTDGKDNNVIKIKPPMVFSIENAEELLLYLTKILKEDFMNS